MPSRWDSITADGSDMRCYVSAPDGTGQHPAIVVVQHASGVDEFVCSMADRLAEVGYVAIAPDLYHREDPKNSDDPLTRMSRLRDASIVVDVNAALEHLEAMDTVRPDRMGITGYCMGGRVTYLMATQSADFRAAVICWGGNIMVPWGEGPAPFDLTDRISCPILGLFGEDDGNPNPADVARLDAELTRLGKTHEFHSYAGAGHAFMDAGRPSFREEATKDAWQKTIAWFARYLKA